MIEGHLVGWEGLGTDGGPTYNRMVERRQARRDSKEKIEAARKRYIATLGPKENKSNKKADAQQQVSKVRARRKRASAEK